MLPADAPTQSVQFKGVGFRYPGQEFEVLDGLDLSIPAGQSLAIVGANGAGKTTLIKLLCRMYDPLQGRILVDGSDLRDLNVHSWHERVAVIFQDFTRFHVTAHENVGYGARTMANQQARLREAAAKAGALNLIESFTARVGDGALEGVHRRRGAFRRAVAAHRVGASVDGS